MKKIEGLDCNDIVCGVRLSYNTLKKLDNEVEQIKVSKSFTRSDLLRKIIEEHFAQV